MVDATDPSDGSRVVEVNLADGADFELQRLAVDEDGAPRSFLLEGCLHRVEEAVLEAMRGRSVTPVAVRFEVGDGPAGAVATSRRTFRTRHADDEPPTAAVVRGLAAVEGVEPTELESLYESVDPDALDALFGTPAGVAEREAAIAVAFTVSNYRVTVRSDGTVAIRVAPGGG